MSEGKAGILAIYQLGVLNPNHSMFCFYLITVIFLIFFFYIPYFLVYCILLRQGCSPR